MSDFMRQCLLMICTGEMGIGKSFLTRKFAEAYHKMHPNRPILIFDPNFEDTWNDFDSIYFDIEEILANRKEEKKRGILLPKTRSEKNIEALKRGIRIIMPFTKSGQKMNPDMMQETMLTCLQNFRGGLAIMDDVNKHTDSFQEERIKGCFKDIRHRSQDIIMHMQSLNPLRPLHYEAATKIRMHHDSIDVDRIAGKAQDKTRVLKISQLIVEEMYNTHMDYAEGTPEYWKRRSYCTHVDLKKKNIMGCTFDQFVKGCQQYLTGHLMELKQIGLEVANRNKRTKPNYQDLDVARIEWIKLRMREGMFDRTKATGIYAN